MKPLHEKIADAFKRIAEEDGRDAALAAEMRKALEPPPRARWKLTADDVVAPLPDGRTVLRFRVTKGKIELWSKTNAPLGECRNVDEATDRVADLMTVALKAYENEQAEQLATQGWSRTQPIQPLYPV